MGQHEYVKAKPYTNHVNNNDNDYRHHGPCG
jgi:hypothetical protein